MVCGWPLKTCLVSTPTNIPQQHIYVLAETKPEFMLYVAMSGWIPSYMLGRKPLYYFENHSLIHVFHTLSHRLSTPDAYSDTSERPNFESP